ncbi:efflux RND transporter periplasmic adaptor subunit [Litoribacillus peritrichatus]|uniref:Multidrug resistance protein MdtA-like barrel-sandwich hybrid domain-containing protein n=1 Tax=Litoribacillus peritrichatus TaxID=718191 RepID=A0ABP7MY12_9GAMM
MILLPEKVHRHQSKLILVAITLVTAAAIITLNLSRTKVKTSPPVDKYWDVEGFIINQGSYSPTIRLFGSIHSSATTTLTSRVSGVVQATPKQDGHLVQNKETLVTIDPSEVDRILQQRLSDLEEAKANLAVEIIRHEFNQRNLVHEKAQLKLADNSVARLKTLKQKNLSAESDLEAALINQTQQALKVSNSQLNIANHKNQVAILKARVNRAEAAFNQTEDDAASTLVQSPFNGRISQVHVAVGDRVNKGSPLITLYSTEHLELRVHAPELTANRIREQITTYHQTPQAIFAHTVIHGIQYRLPFERLAGKVLQGSGGIDAVFSFQQPLKQLPLGKTLAVDIVLPGIPNTLVVPASSIYQQKYVYLITDQKLQSVAIKRLGVWANPSQPTLSFWVVEGKLSSGDTILSSLLPNAIDGLKVRVHEQ